MKTLVLVSLFLVACGGPSFQEEESTEADSGADSNPGITEVDSGSDSNLPVPDSTPPLPPEAGTDGTGSLEADAWPTDVILVPYCPTSEVYPAHSDVCYQWGQAHGWILSGCCLPDHSCGVVSGSSPAICRK